MVSFAGGLPDAQSFPLISAEMLDGFSSALQYGPTEGDLTLRQKIADNFNQHGATVSPEQVLVLSGSQQGIDLVAKLFVDEGTAVAVESPTYLAALQTFDLFGARYNTFDVSLAGLGQAVDNARLLYTVPTFQNPSGHCYSTQQRSQLAAACDATGTVLFEDDPYRTLCYAPCDRTPIVTMVKSTSWIYQSSFSKEFAPGLRLGYLVSSPDLVERLQWLKQASDLHTNRLSEQIILSLLNAKNAAERLIEICDRYRQKRDNFQASLTEHLGDIADWELPVGGLFFWLKLKEAIARDTRTLLKPAIDRGVAFMPGESFFPRGADSYSALRLNFSHADSNAADHGLATLAKLLRS
jgi:DNA-binding transcriptional MocR family regulator